ncbi:MAG TPA: type I DNA topoisomerase [Thermoanaerobaculaceae bacterium]|nr:type I DNA topoisomerase [Thermoanaerobaculaceae bacterium]HPS77621.1 type I DNA topoisomerase [Thermoanaerobaculaceae bacterium]
MSTALVIVESPAKARTLGRYLGKGYVVMASVGHVRDLPRNDLGIDVADGFAPRYQVMPAKRKVINEIRAAAGHADEILVATDPDREGEAIGWHLAELLRDSGKPISRVLFHEITRRAVQEAIAHPRPIDAHLVDAQQARRVLDRLVGYKLSPLLWDKVKRGLSAGRVQSVALKMICDREAEIEAFVPEEYWHLDALLGADQPPSFVARLAFRDGKKLHVRDGETAAAIRGEVENAPFVVASVARRRRQQKAPPPFVTAKLQQAAAGRFRFAVRKTMQLAQRLYEGVDLGGGERVGLITYMRTDSLRVAPEAIEAVRGFIAGTYGPELLPDKPNYFKNRSEAQDAHEAIRPSDPTRTPESVAAHLEADALKLYTLIWQRFVASQMTPAQFDVTDVVVRAGRYGFKARGEVEVEPGYLRVYREEEEAPPPRKVADADDEEPTTRRLPPLAEGQVLRLEKLDALQKFTQPPPRFTEATLVKALEENGIGRPSTYAQIISVISDRDYVSKEKGAFSPSELGKLVNRLLVGSFADLINERYTARMEEELDAVAEGKEDWRQTLNRFWGAFEADLRKAGSEMQSVKRQGVETSERCPTCGSPMILRFGRYGEYLACSRYPECRTTREPGAVQPTEETPVCPECGAGMIQKRSRFGPFWACSRYPECKGTRRLTKGPQSPNTPSGVRCPREGCDGEVVEKRSRRGKPFWGCNRYPKCTFTLNARPLPRPCPTCGAVFVLEKKTVRRGTEWVCATEGCTYRVPAE